jgi:pantoate--beta-alanine ligase
MSSISAQKTDMSHDDGIKIARNASDLRRHVQAWRREGLSVALVPTMGGIHEGHLSLVHLGRTRCDRTIASLFVNPSQFGENEDFASYPVNEERDCDLLGKAGVGLLYAPSVEAMYPEGFRTSIKVGALTEGLCGPCRPGHFDGVATVVAKLLLQAAPDVALFGEKDYQQLMVIRQVARDLDIPVEIVGGPTFREPDGLAMSTRNGYLSADERRFAPVLYKALCDVAARVADGKTDCAEACAIAGNSLAAAGFRSIDYITVCDAETLAPVERVTGPARVLGAAWLGKARLIDNLAVDPVSS